MKNFKYFTIALLAFGLTFTACKKAENQTVETEQTEETGLEQDAKILQNEAGDQLKVVYYAEGDKAAVKLTKNSEPEQTLVAKVVSSRGNPVFANDNMMWEMDEGGLSGTLTDKAGKEEKFREPETEE